MSATWQYDPIQGQGHGGLKVAKLADFRVNLLRQFAWIMILQDSIYILIEQICDIRSRSVSSASCLLGILDDIFETGGPIDFVFDSVVGFSGSENWMALFPVWSNPRWRAWHNMMTWLEGRCRQQPTSRAPFDHIWAMVWSGARGNINITAL